MMTIPQPPIKFGPHAGQPRPLIDVLLDRATAVRNVLAKLRNSGYQVIDYRLEGARPTVELEAHTDLARLIDEGVACYYIQRPGPSGLGERVGQFVVDGVRLVWTERVG